MTSLFPSAFLLFGHALTSVICSSPLIIQIGPVDPLPYSPGIRIQNTTFLSDVERPGAKNGLEEARQVLEGMSEALKVVGMTLKNVVMTRVFLTDWKEYEEIDKAYNESFHGNFPARSVFQVSRLPTTARLGIEVIAMDSSP